MKIGLIVFQNRYSILILNTNQSATKIVKCSKTFGRDHAFVHEKSVSLQKLFHRKVAYVQIIQHAIKTSWVVRASDLGISLFEKNQLETSNISEYVKYCVLVLKYSRNSEKTNYLASSYIAVSQYCKNQILPVQTKFLQFSKTFGRQLFCDAFVDLLESFDSIGTNYLD